MHRHSPVIWNDLSLAAIALMSFAVMSFTGGFAQAPAARKQIDLSNKVAQQLRQRLLVQPGTLQQAKDYYQRISQANELAFNFEQSNLDALLAYMGYVTVSGEIPRFTGLLATDLETIPSFDLMPQDEAAFLRLKGLVSDPDGFDDLLNLFDFQQNRVLVSRFFAPKIATYFDDSDPFRPIDPDDIVPGWRKLIRLKPRNDSRAQAAGVKHLYLLFNFKKADPDVDPFAGNESGNNQVIIVPTDQTAKDSSYFAVYKSQTDGYAIGYFLSADFDLPGHVAVTTPGAENGRYFIPRSCAECHGHSGGDFLMGRGLTGQPVDDKKQPTDDFKTGRYTFAKPNYLDTDQWYDWMEFDYRGVATSLNDVLFDGGKAHGAARYAKAFGVIKTINADIRDETFAAEQVTGQKSYQTLAAERWLALHDPNVQRVPYAERSIGNQTWDRSSKDDMRLLRLLNNHCFRCHSSLRYNVFDKERVGQLKPVINGYLRQTVVDADGSPLPGFFMPQGRVLQAQDRDEILRLLTEVFP